MMLKLLMDAKQNEVKRKSMRLTIEIVSCGGPVSSTIGYLRPYFPKMTSQLSWFLIGGEDLRKIFGKSSESSSENGGF